MGWESEDGEGEDEGGEDEELHFSSLVVVEMTVRKLAVVLVK